MRGALGAGGGVATCVGTGVGFVDDACGAGDGDGVGVGGAEAAVDAVGLGDGVIVGDVALCAFDVQDAAISASAMNVTVLRVRSPSGRIRIDCAGVQRRLSMGYLTGELAPMRSIHRKAKVVRA